MIAALLQRGVVLGYCGVPNALRPKAQVRATLARYREVC
jgi:hypothetical protein